jgi:hypothetical protein
LPHDHRAVLVDSDRATKIRHRPHAEVMFLLSRLASGKACFIMHVCPNR